MNLKFWIFILVETQCYDWSKINAYSEIQMNQANIIQIQRFIFNANSIISMNIIILRGNSKEMWIIHLFFHVRFFLFCHNFRIYQFLMNTSVVYISFGGSQNKTDTQTPNTLTAIIFYLLLFFFSIGLWFASESKSSRK